MQTFTTQQERTPVAPGPAVIRIMRVLPITIPMPLRIEPKVSMGTPLTQPGARVAVGGTIRAGGFGARLIYRRVERGTSLPLEEASCQRIALLHDRSLEIHAQAIERSKAGSQPDLWIQYLSTGGAPIAPPARLGRCDHGPFDLNPELPVDLFVDTAVLKAKSFDLAPSTGFEISGEVAVRSGVTARLMISEGDQPEDRPIEMTAIDVPLIPENTIVRLPRRRLHTTLGRDSWIYLAFLDGTGHVLGGESLLGRAQPDLAMLQNGWGPSIPSSADRAAAH